jgi:hypothetical protein
MIPVIREHLLLALVLCGALCFYLIFQLQYQAPEPYNYATAIEGYFGNSFGFELAQGQKLPDISRYHPNHPLGHVLAGLAYDWLGIPALAWMRFVNILGALFAGLFLYQIARYYGLAKNLSVLTVSLFLSTNCGMFTVLSGEWHIPAIALSLAGIRQILSYIDGGSVMHLYRASLLFAVASCYHLWALFYLVPLAIVLLFVRPIKKFWRELLKAALLIFLILLVVYLILPFVLFRFRSSEEFLRTFLMYKYLTHTQYAGFEWLQIAGRTLFHTFLYTPVRFKGTDLSVLVFLVALTFAFWRFYKSERTGPQKAIILLVPIWWPIMQVAIGARPDGLLGWLFAWPFICLIIVKALSGIDRRAAYFGAALTAFTFAWNFSLAYYPNSQSKPENVFYFTLPGQIPVTTPVAFVISQPLLMMGDIWYAGSKLGYRKQMHFMPCCGEYNYMVHLKRWALENPGFVLVSDGHQSQLEGFIRAQGLHYRLWSDRQGDWPSSLIQTTLYVQHTAPNFYPKRLTIWAPDKLLGLP